MCTVSAVMLGKIRSKLTFSSSCRWTANFSMDLGRKICLNDTAVPIYKWRWYHNYNDESWKTPSKYKTDRLAKIWLIWVVLVFLSVLTNTRHTRLSVLEEIKKDTNCDCDFNPTENLTFYECVMIYYWSIKKKITIIIRSCCIIESNCKENHWNNFVTL